MDESDRPASEEPEGSSTSSQQVRIEHVTARVLPRVSGGAFSTGVIVMGGGTEFALDFLQSVGHPPQVAARVIMPHAALPQFIDALRKNLEMYSQRFGKPPELPRAPAGRTPSVQELYDDLKFPDDLLGGSYANGVVISHTPAEFKFDFVARLFPHPAVTCRVFLAAPQVPRMLESMISAHEQFRQRLQPPRGGAEPPPDPPGPAPPPGGG